MAIWSDIYGAAASKLSQWTTCPPGKVWTLLGCMPAPTKENVSAAVSTARDMTLPPFVTTAPNLYDPKKTDRLLFGFINLDEPFAFTKRSGLGDAATRFLYKAAFIIIAAVILYFVLKAYSVKLAARLPGGA